MRTPRTAAVAAAAKAIPAPARMTADPLADHDQIEIDRTAFYRQPGLIRQYREYAAGVQPVTLTEEQRDILSGLLGNTFSDNVCHQILAEAGARLDLLRFDVDNDGVKSFLADTALRAGLDDLSGQAHYAALRDGDFALTLGWDAQAGRVTVLQEPWWDGQNGVFIAYNAQGNALYAVKEWDTLEGFRRRTVWFEDRIERYAHDGGAWLPFALPSDTYDNSGSGPEWPAPWVKADGSALHIPLVHFANLSRGTGYSGYALYGTSELAGGVLGFQDQLNDQQMDMSAAARLTGYQMLWATGMPKPKDAAGADVPFTVSPGGVLHASAPEARFGVLPAGDLSQLIAIYGEKLKAVSRMTRTPLHTITGGDWPSGEALLRSELPAINKAAAQIKKFAMAWAEVAHRATEIANVFGKAGLDEGETISAVFAPPDKRDPLSLAAMVETIAPYVSEEEILRLLQYPPDKVTQIMGERAADLKRVPPPPPAVNPIAVMPAPAPPADVKVKADVPTAQG